MVALGIGLTSFPENQSIEKYKKKMAKVRILMMLNKIKICDTIYKAQCNKTVFHYKYIYE